ISVADVRADTDAEVADTVAADGGERVPTRTFWKRFFDHGDELDAESRAVVEASFERIVENDWEGAANRLRDRFESVCERKHPTLQNEAHPASCHLYDQSDDAA